MKKIPFHVINNSKSQISVDFLGNTPSPIYQQGAEFVQNAIVVPEGSTKKRAGTRFVALALQGDKTRIKIINGRLFVVGDDFAYMIDGFDVLTSKRTTKPSFDGTNINNAFPSDVLIDQSGDTPVYIATNTASSNVDNDLYFVNRDNLKYDTYLHKNDSANLGGFDIAPTNNLGVANFLENPDAGGAQTYSSFNTFGGSKINTGDLEVITKIPLSYKVDLSKGAVYNKSLFIPYEGLSAIAQFQLNDRISPIFYKSEITQDYRILKINEPSNKEIDDVTNFWLFKVITNVPANYITTFKKVYGSTTFQNRLVIMAETDEIKLFFSAVGDPLNFEIPNSPNASSPFTTNINALTNSIPTLIHGFGNSLVIGTVDSTYVLQAAAGVEIDAQNPLSLVKISDIGVSNATPVLHDSKLYVVTNDGQGMMMLQKNPFGQDIQAIRIVSFSDSLRTNGIIKKLVYWRWDYQYLGLLMSDGCFVKANLDSQSVNFNQWVFDTATILDVEVLSTEFQEDVIYFVVQRGAATFIEAMLHNQDVQKNEHSYSCIRERRIEEESVNKYRSTVLSRYANNGTFNDCAVTLKIRINAGTTYAVNGSQMLISGQNDTLMRGDLVAGEFEVLSQVGPQEYLVDNPRGKVVLPEELVGRIERKNWPYALLSSPLSANVDGKAFLNDVIVTGGMLMLNVRGREVTVGKAYRFIMVSTDIVVPFGVEGIRKPRVLNTVSVMFNFTPLVEVGKNLGRLDYHRVEYRRWMQFSVFNGEEQEARLCLKVDAPSPIEVVSIAGEYGA